MEANMATKKKTVLTVKQDAIISDGEGGLLPKGAKFEPADERAAESLKAKGFAE
jgi:hypothetical protein